MRCFVVRFLFVFTLLWAGCAWGIDSYALEPSPELAFSQLPKTLSDSLDAQGIRLVSSTYGKKAPLFDVWWRKEVPAQESRPRAGSLIYRGLKQGEFLGVVSFLRLQEDFQHHPMQPGLYTMRYVQLAQDGKDDAVSLYPDFVMLSPAWTDKEAATLVPMDELRKRGSLASHKDEPAVLSLVPVNPNYKTFPWAVADDRGFCTLQVRLQQQIKHKTSDLPFAIVLVRPFFENEGS